MKSFVTVSQVGEGVEGGWYHSDGDVIRGNDNTAVVRVCYNLYT